MAADSSGLPSIQSGEDLAGVPAEELLSHRDCKIPEKDSGRPGLSHTPSSGPGVSVLAPKAQEEARGCVSFRLDIRA